MWAGEQSGRSSSGSDRWAAAFHFLRLILKGLIPFVAIAPAVFLILQVTRHWVDVPFADDWDISLVLNKHYGGGVDLKTLFAQHNESRTAFPRLIILGLGIMSKYDVRWEMCVTLLFAVVISINMLRLLRRLDPPSWPECLAVYFFCNLLLFTPAQWINWLTGIQFVVFVPPLMLTSGLLLTASNARIWAKTAGAALASFVGTYSYANGMLLWLFLCPLELLGIRPHSKRSPFASLIQPRLLYAASAAASILFYFHDYHKPPQSPPLAAAVEDPVQTTGFLLAWMGGPFSAEGSRHSDGVAMALGGVVLVAFLLGMWCALRARDGSRRRGLYPWMALGLYSLASGLVTTAGRVGDGLVVARVSRYTSFSLYLPIAAIVLLWTMRSRRRWAIPAYGCGLAAVLLLHGQAVSDSMKKMESFSQRLHDGRLAIQLSRIIRDDTLLNPLYPGPSHLLERFEALRLHGMLNFLAVDPQVLTDHVAATGDPRPACGFLDRCVVSAPDLVHYSGWAHLIHRGRPATNAVLTWSEPNGVPHPFALHLIRLPRRDVAVSLGQPEHIPYGFAGVSRLPENRPPRVTVYAWTVDLEEGVAYRLEGAYPVRSRSFSRGAEPKTERSPRGTPES